MTIDTLLILAEVAATLVFAISGIIEAVRKKMDVVGIFAMAFITAFGGGTVRDLLLDRRPLFWVQNHEYVWLVLFLTLVAPPLGSVLRHRWVDWVLKGTDAFGLGLFSVTGALLAQAANMPLIVVLIIGVITGVFGGVMRDVMCGEIPVVFRSHQPYALCAFFGCLVYWILHVLGTALWIQLTAGAGVTTVSCLFALIGDWRVPEWPKTQRGAD